MSKDIKILFLAANPYDTTRLRLDEEIRAIDHVLRETRFSDKFDIRQHWAVRVSDVQNYLMRHEPHIVHFSGHGSKSSGIILEDNSGKSHPVSVRALSQLFFVLKGNIQCVVLNACYSEKQARAIVKHIDYVIGMSESIGDVSAISFAAAFYQALGFDKDIPTAFKLGCLQIDLQNLNEQNKPKLLAKSKVTASTTLINQAIPIENETSKINPWIELSQKTYEWLIEDQIVESSGWGKSHYSVMKRITGKEMTPLEKKEGGIITTFMALRALMNYEGDAHKFRHKEYAQKALNYFLHRQTKKGGFGRHVKSRSGIEIHPSIRHTSFAISSLIDLNGPPKAIKHGLEYLSKNWSSENLLDDAAPSLAIGGIIYAVDKFLSNPTYVDLLTNEERTQLNLTDWSETKKLLLRELVELSKSSNFNPFWIPYGHYETMIFDTALTTIDLIANPLPDILAPTVIDMLSIIIEHISSGGVPYNLGMRKPDVGMSAYLLSIISRPNFLEKLGNNQIALELKSAGGEIYKFLLNNIHDPKYRRFTYCDTFANLLLSFPKKIIEWQQQPNNSFNRTRN